MRFQPAFFIDAVFRLGFISSFVVDLSAAFANSALISSVAKSTSSLQSTPFDASLYEDDDNSAASAADLASLASANPFASDHSPLAAPPGTKLVVGLNKYSHDTTLCAADARTGDVLFAMSKERLTRKKHDSGNVASLVDRCLEQLNLDLDSIERVVLNNHHHRVLPLEDDADAIEWEEGLQINDGAESGYGDEENLLSHAEKLEMSHHLAHAYSAAAQCPFDEGMVVVMDGMGETYRAMRSSADSREKRYVSDLQFEGTFQCIPPDIREKSQSSIFDWREGESVYTFEKGGKDISVKPVFKRFVEEKTPPARYNHGFENMDSAGALYSRASSHIFGDWNACGKVMGLAPWMSHQWEDIEVNQIKDSIMSGKLYEEGKDGFRSNVSAMKGMPHIARTDPDLFDDDGNMRKRYDFDDYTPKESKDESTSDSSPTADEGNTATAVQTERRSPRYSALNQSCGTKIRALALNRGVLLC